ncbi:MAG: helix-turn-helix domain-containing protein [Chloroflexi bacterium]|nr:helix-turn-helix domain-containing protein [Chloroflexota bacterium]
MEKVTARKKLTVVKLYLSGLSYDEIATRGGVSKGTVANVVNELKAGMVPEAADVGEHIELLRELSLDLKRSRLSPGQCATGLILLNRISECGLDPADIDRWPMILKSVRNQDDAKEFVGLVYSIQQVQQRSGLSLEALDNKVRELERKAADLEPMSEKLEDCKKQITELTRQREELASSVAILEQKHELLTPRVKDLEKREETLSRRIADMEPKAQKAETTLSALKGAIQTLNDIGFSLKELAEFNEKLQVIAQRHAIEPPKLKNRLLHELETLDRVLALETLIQSRQQELDKTEQALMRTKKEIETTRVIVDSFKQEKINLEVSIRETREKVSREIAKIIPLAQDTIDKLGEELRRGNDEALAEVRRLRDEAMEVGKDVGRYEGILQVNAWLSDLPALIRGEEGITGNRVKTMALPVVRGLDIWLKRQDSLSFTLLPLTVQTLISELEQWKT